MRKQQSRMMSEKSLGKPNYSKWEKRAFRVAQRVRRQVSQPEWMNTINVSYHEARPVIAEREHIFYPDDWGYQKLPRINVRIRLRRKLRTIVITLPNKRIAKLNKERDAIDSEKYVLRDGDGIMRGGQVRKESPVIRPGIVLC